MKGLADYMTASASRQRVILRQFKYPLEDESRAKILYYREARDRIFAYHKADRGRDWLTNEASVLEALARASGGRTGQRLRHNARAISSYATNFSSRQFEILKDLSLNLAKAGVRISAIPDLHVTEGKRAKIIKLDFSKDPPPLQLVRVVSQVMLEASDAAGLGLTGSAVLYLDVPRGAEYRAARSGSRIARDIEASCATIAAVWDSI
jgi:hypothetical protein